MTSQTLLSCVLLALLGLPGASEAAGQDVSSPYRYIETSHEGSLFVGTLSPGTGRFDLGPEAGPTLGARYALEISGPFSIEGVVRTLSSERAVIDPARVEGKRQVGVADAQIASLDARAKFSLTGRRTWNGIGPYALLGGGLAVDLAGSSQADQNVRNARDRYDFGTSFLGVLGAGVRWLPSDRFVVRSDALLNLWQIETPDGWQDQGRGLDLEAVPDSEWVSGLSFTVGVGYRW